MPAAADHLLLVAAAGTEHGARSVDRTDSFATLDCSVAAVAFAATTTAVSMPYVYLF